MFKFFIVVLILSLFSLASCSHKSAISLSEKKEVNSKISQFFEDYFEKQVSRYPTWQTYLGRKTNYHLLDNESMEYSDEEHKLTQETLSKLEEFNYEALDHDTKLSYDILKFQLENRIESYNWRFHHFPLNQMFGFQSETPSFLINMHQIENETDAKAYISRLKEISRVFAEKMVFYKKQEALGIFPPHFVFSKVIEDSKNIITGKPFTPHGESPLYQDFKAKIKKLKMSQKKKNALLNQAKESLKKYVLPSYQELIVYVGHLSTKNRHNHGAWSLPDGKDYYDYALRSITTTDLSADEIHEVGLKEVARIQVQMKEIMTLVGFKGSLQEFFQHLRGESFHYPNSKAGRAAYLKEVNIVVENIKKALPKLFKTFPKAELLVKPVEAFREKSAGTAFYSGPSMEGNRPGIYYVNLYKMADNPKYRLEALAYHEAIPGHHMQIAIANELLGIPKFRRTSGFTAYTEGWGLYSELLPKEIGFYQDPYSDFGRLSMEIWRAVRLVVDTGIHAKRWSREKAISYMMENSPSAELETMKEVERYFVMPGQATAYKVGMMKFLELREKSKKSLGSKFDIKEYHDVVLKDGSLPLNLLEEKVNNWIKTQK